MILDRVPVSMSRKNIIIIINIIIIRWSVAAPHLCDVKCGKEITCQSYNYNRKYQICELNIILLLIRLSEFCKLFSDFVR